jgi:hypothetical protein
MIQTYTCNSGTPEWVMGCTRPYLKLWQNSLLSILTSALHESEPEQSFWNLPPVLCHSYTKEGDKYNFQFGEKIFIKWFHFNLWLRLSTWKGEVMEKIKQCVWHIEVVNKWFPSFLHLLRTGYSTQLCWLN